MTASRDGVMCTNGDAISSDLLESKREVYKIFPERGGAERSPILNYARCRLYTEKDILTIERETPVSTLFALLIA